MAIATTKTTPRVSASEVELKSEVVKVKRVTKVTKGGRILSFTAVVVSGNGQGVVGHGLGKAKEVNMAVQKASDQARRNLIKVALRHGRIPHEITVKYKGSSIWLKPATPGTGIVAGDTARAVLERAGVHNVLTKLKGSSNPHNVVQATVKALAELRSAAMVAEQRGITVERVFNG